MAIEDGAGGAKTFTISAFQDITIQNFGGFGQGNVPANPGELDTLAFDDPNLSAADMTMTQQGTSVVIGFVNPPFDTTRVTLENTTIAELENLAALGNFKFFGEAAVTNSLDVWDAGQVDDRIRRWDTVTFLNNLDNHVIGLGSGDVIHALDGNDEIDGRSGDDVIRGGDGNDRLIGGIGNDQLFGDAGDDRLEGGRGNDLLDGGTGNDVMIGGKGEDIYVVDSAGDIVIEDIRNSRGGGWADEVRSSIAFSLAALDKVENLTLTGEDSIDGTGNALANALIGNSGDNTLNGAAGNDVLQGGGGNDTFQGGSGDDVIVLGPGETAYVNGGTGIDTVMANDFGPVLDFTGTLRETFQNVEVIDLNVFQLNTVILDAASIAQINGSTDNAFGPNTLLITGDQGDSVSLSDPNWVKGEEVVDPLGQSGNYISWTHGAATVLIETELAVLQIGDIDLADLTPAQGFKILGVAPDDATGNSVSTIGDVNADGIDDLIVGAALADPGSGANAGQSYVVYGKAGGLSDIELKSLTPAEGFKISGAAAGDVSGNSVSDAGDVNGDGIADILIAAAGADPLGRTGAGQTYVVYGKAGGVGDIDLGALTMAQGFSVFGSADFSGSGSSVRSAGDVNGDGIDDIIIGAPSSIYQGGPASGEAYVIYGKLGGLGDIDLAALTATDGFKITTTRTSDYTGRSVSGIGDVNGDGFDDVAVGAEFGVPGRGYVIFGGADLPGAVELQTLDPTDGFKLGSFDSDTESSGLVVSGAGDINGDGFEDLAVADAEQGPYSGRTAVIYGKLGGPGDLKLGALTPEQGFSIFGVAEQDGSGRSISSAGDVNGDGIDDLLIGAPDADPGGRGEAGEAYLIFGKASGLGDIDLAVLTPDQGLKISGAVEDDSTGSSVRAAGDINGDGYADMVIGAPQRGFPEPGTGQAYVLYGGDFTNAVTHSGTDDNDMLVGTASDEVFIGGLGNDSLSGNGGADAFHGGAGDDAIHVSDGSFKRVDGGNGADALHLDIDGLVDLGDIDGDATSAQHTKIQSIEIIDTDNGFSNQIVLHVADVLEIDANNHDVGGAASLDNALKIDGDAGDSLSLDPADGWGAADTATLPGYAIYAAGNVKIAIDQDITVAVA